MVKGKQIDYALYLVTDRHYLGGRDLVAEVLKAVAGGVTVVQLREKNANSRDFYQLALALKEALVPRGVPLIINDRLDIALAADADGLHVGQEDLPVTVVRPLLGEDKIIGLSVSNEEELREGENTGADYLGVGPVFATPTKDDAAAPLGIEKLRLLRQKTRLPLVAIGGIDLDNLKAVRDTGMDGVAVVSALMTSPDIQAAARRMINLWQNR
ncbi:thiamine phosphate synthase [Desulfallas thermosapovorans]|uniref:thiamine phosphate synthase n=1 Tax=Desulfallas thermosapovorans TaxID=58137 RepID=UPI001412CCBA|nr:thiamine phosphate synthase [Desulfallas thermosapovorans]